MFRRIAALALGLTIAVPATAVAADLPIKQQNRKGKAPETLLGAAREESGNKDRPPSRHELPAGELRLSASELLAGFQQSLELTATLNRDVDDATLEVTLPERWLQRSGVSDLPYARVPQGKRKDRVVSFSFPNGRAGESQSFSLQDVGIPAGSYELPYRWRGAGGSDKGTATVIFYPPVRESTESPEFLGKLPSPGFEKNTTNDALTESETFLTVVPGNKLRFVAGANGGGGGYNAWITNNGGQSFTKSIMPTLMDAPGEAGPETASNCCDPMSAADTAGNIWYGGLTFANGAGNPSRIVVGRIAPGEVAFQPQTVGLQARTTGTQDKPLMTIDNSPTSPTYGMLYVVWNEPAGGINVVISQCDTRPVGNTLNAANCDNADNWTAPVSVTPATGSYIYADVATGPDGKVYVVWWDYSATNAIRGDVCDPATQNCASAAGWGTPETIATLDSTGGPIPFSCPIVAQPGGRASTAANVEVDRSASGPNRGRVYVTWSDLRTGSGSTKCGGSTAPATTHLNFDSYVASAPGALPGSAAPSPSVATRLIADGEGGATADDWFPWLAVDQTNGRAWADVYSTRHDDTRKTTHFYAREVVPAAGGSHTLGALTQVSTQPSDYSNEPCCNFGNQYGDYTGIDATSGVAIPIWSDKRASDPDGEAYTYVGNDFPVLEADTRTLDDSAGGDGDGALEPGESFQLTQRVKNVGGAPATGVSGKLSETEAKLSLSRASSTYPNIAAGASAANATKFVGTLSETAQCGTPVQLKLDVKTTQGSFSLPLSIPTGTVGAAQSTTATPGATIPDNDPNGTTSTINLTGPGTVADLNVQVDITHTWVSDVTIYLIAPDGTEITLASRHGSSGDNYTGTVFDDEAAISIGAGNAPFTGSFRPIHALSAMDGKPAAGAWKLKVTDAVSQDQGTLNSWGTAVSRAACSAPLPRKRADFNGDGFSDLAAGAPGEDIGAGADAGAINVAYGSATGLKSTGSVAFTSDSLGVPGTSNGGDRFGAALAAGNFNEDRFADLAIGAPGDEAGAVTDAGSVTVLYGSPTGLSGTGAELFTQPVAAGAPADANAEPGDAFGSALATGNLGKTSTSFDDIAVGSPLEDVGGLNDAGAIQVLFSGATGGINPLGRQFLTQSALGANPSEAGDKFGSALAAANFNSATTLDDLAIGVPFQDAGAIVDSGAVHVATGGTTGLSTASDVVFNQSAPAAVPGDNQAGDQFGAALAAGDFAGGSSAEVVVGVPGKRVGGLAGAGQVIVLPGSATGTTATGSFARDQNTTDVADVAEAGDRFGAALALADFGGTGQGDLAIGTPNESVGAVGQAGQVSVLLGSTAAVPPVAGNQVINQNTADVLDTSEASDHFGAALAAGQFGSGEKADLIVGIPDENAGATADTGAVQLLLAGPSAGLTATGNQFRTQGAAPQLGQTLEAGDLLGTALG